MPINYPVSVDLLRTDRRNGLPPIGEPVDANDINDIARYLNAIATELGITPSGVYADVAARFAVLQPSSVVNAVLEGADPTGVTFSTTALINAWTKYLAGAYSAFVIPPGTYKIDPGTTTPMFSATGKKGIRVEGAGATLNDVHNYSSAVSGNLFTLFGCDDTYINLNVVSTINPGGVYAGGDRGLRVVTCQANGTYGGQGLEFIGRYEGCLTAFTAVKLGADVDSMKLRNVRIKIQTYNTFYPLSFQFSGDNVYAEADIERCGRAYFPYGIRNHEIHINVKNQKLQSVIGGGTSGALDAPYCGCENIELHYRDRESDVGTVFGGSGQGVEIVWRWDAGNPGAVTHKNLNLYMDTKSNLGGGFWSMLSHVQFRKQLVGGASDTTTRGHTLDGCRIFGTIDGDTGGASAPIDNFSNEVTTGDPHLNCVCEARISGLVNPNFPPGWIRRFSGTGSPENVVAAPPGSTFNRTDGGAATSFYVKESGVAKTGWVGTEDARRYMTFDGGVVDQTANMQAGLDALNALGGGVFELPSGGIARIAGTVLGYSNVKIRGNGATLLFDDALGAGGNPAGIDFTGTNANATTLSVAAADGDKTLTLTSATGYSVGDIVELSSTVVQDGSWTSRAIAVAGNVLTMEEPCPIDITAAHSQVTRMVPLSNFSVRDLHLKCTWGATPTRQRLLRMQYVVDAEVDNVWLEFQNQPGLTLAAGVFAFHGRNVAVRNCKVEGVQGPNTDVAIYVANITAADVRGNTVRRSSRGIVVSACPHSTAAQNRCFGEWTTALGGRGMNLDNNSNYSTVAGNTFSGFLVGTISGLQVDDTKGACVTGNTFKDIGGPGIGLGGFGQGSYHCTVTGNVIRRCGSNNSSSHGIVVSQGGGVASFMSHNVIAGNFIGHHGGDTTCAGIAVQTSGNEVSGNVLETISGDGITVGTSATDNGIHSNTIRGVGSGRWAMITNASAGGNRIGPNNFGGIKCLIHGSDVWAPDGESQSLTQTGGGTLAINTSQGRTVFITITDGVAFTLGFPTPIVKNARLTLIFLNSSGGAAGAVTATTATGWKLAGGVALVMPANGKMRAYDFVTDGSNWCEVGGRGGDL